MFTRHAFFYSTLYFGLDRPVAPVCQKIWAPCKATLRQASCRCRRAWLNSSHQPHITKHKSATPRSSGRVFILAQTASLLTVGALKPGVWISGSCSMIYSFVERSQRLAPFPFDAAAVRRSLLGCASSGKCPIEHNQSASSSSQPTPSVRQFLTPFRFLVNLLSNRFLSHLSFC